MVTAILIILAVLCVVGLVGMFVAACRGDLCAQLWWCFGGAGHLVEFLGGLVQAIAEGLSRS
jgi:hypothetical protein